IIAAVQEVWPKHLPIFVRISATDWLGAEGWDLEDSIALAKILKKQGVDLVDCSSGANVRQVEIPVAPNYQVPFAEGVKKGATIATAAVGLITEAHQAEGILQEEKADLIFIGRALLRDPYFALQAAKVLEEEIAWPLQYERGR